MHLNMGYTGLRGEAQKRISENWLIFVDAHPAWGL